MLLSIIIPVFNESQTIKTAIEQVINQELSGWQKEIVVVDDGSTDGCHEILSGLKSQYNNLVVLKHKQNLGKAAALRTGLAAAHGELILVQDADLEYTPADWPHLLQLFDNPETMVVYGSRNLAPRSRGYFTYYLGDLFLSGLVDLLLKTKLTDVYTCTKVFRNKIIKQLNLTSQNFDIEAEITVKLLKQGIKILEAPINYYPRTHQAGKKLGFKDGLSGLWSIIKHWLVD